MRSLFMGLVAAALLCLGNPAAVRAQDTPIAEEDLHKHFKNLRQGRQKNLTPVPEETRFSYWGYRHDDLHVYKLIDEMQERAGNTCCNGPHSGECRVSEVDMGSKKVLIDGRWCPVGDKTKVLPLDGLQAIREDEKSIAVVCAGRTYKECPIAHCVGVQVRM